MYLQKFRKFPTAVLAGHPQEPGKRDTGSLNYKAVFTPLLVASLVLVPVRTSRNVAYNRRVSRKAAIALLIPIIKA